MASSETVHARPTGRCARSTGVTAKTPARRGPAHRRTPLRAGNASRAASTRSATAPVDDHPPNPRRAQRCRRRDPDRAGRPGPGARAFRPVARRAAASKDRRRSGPSRGCSRRSTSPRRAACRCVSGPVRRGPTRRAGRAGATSPTGARGDARREHGRARARAAARSGRSARRCGSSVSEPDADERGSTRSVRDPPYERRHRDPTTPRSRKGPSPLPEPVEVRDRQSPDRPRSPSQPSRASRPTRVRVVPGRRRRG